MIAVLSAVLYPALATKLRAGMTASLAQTFAGLAQGIAEFKRATTRYPSSLTLLTSTPAATDDDICNNDITSTNAALWKGPYVSRMISSSGIVMGDATIQATLRRDATGTPIFLMIDAGPVRTEIADELEAQLDAGTASGTAGTIRYQVSGVGTLGDAGAGTYNVSYAIPINSC
jgi:hypothetical protein